VDDNTGVPDQLGRLYRLKAMAHGAVRDAAERSARLRGRETLLRVIAERLNWFDSA
jgi:hypothetical protein